MSIPIIAFAGLDGSGKTTQLEQIKKNFESYGFKVKIQRHFETDIGKNCEIIITQTKNPIIRALAFALDEYSQKIENETDNKYDIILCDRSHFCALAYSQAQGLSEKWIRTLYEYSQSYTVCIYLDIATEISRKHKNTDQFSPNISKEQFESVRNLYLQMVQKGEIRFVNANKSFEEVTKDIEKIIWELL